MSISKQDPRVTGVEIEASILAFELDDGTRASAGLERFPILRAGTEDQQAEWRVIHGGRAVRWPRLDEDISVHSLLHPERSIPMRPEAVERHVRRLERRRAREGAGRRT